MTSSRSTSTTRPGIVGCYLLETEDGPALFDCGPTTCVPQLKAGLAERGLALSDVRHLLLSHIHLDHAGAAGVLVREHPALQVHVSGSAHRTSSIRRSSRRALGGSTEMPSTRSGASWLRSRRRTSTSSATPWWGSSASRHPGTRGTTSRISTPTARSTRETPPECGSHPGASSPLRALHPSSTRGVGADDRRDREPRAGAPRAHPLRRLRRRPEPPRRTPGDARELVGPRRGRHGRGHVRRRRPLRRLADRPRPRRHVRPRRAVLAPLPGIERYWRKRREPAAPQP